MSTEMQDIVLEERNDPWSNVQSSGPPIEPQVLAPEPQDPWNNLQRSGSIRVRATYNPDAALSRSMRAQPVQQPRPGQGHINLTPAQEERRQRELNRQDQIAQESPEAVQQRLAKAKNDNCCAAIVSLIYFVVFGSIVLWNKKSRHNQALLAVKDEIPGVASFVTIAIYYHGLCFFLESFATISLNVSNQRMFSIMTLWIFLGKLVIMSYGIHQAWTKPEFKQMQMRETGNDAELFNDAEIISGVVKALIILWIIPVATVVCIVLCVICAISQQRGQPNSMTAHQQNASSIQRIPGAAIFIKNHSRNYDPTKDGKESCIICLEEFAENDGKRIAELNCGHIYHEDCLQDWVKKNDACPMCRAPIKNENKEFD